MFESTLNSPQRRVASITRTSVGRKMLMNDMRRRWMAAAGHHDELTWRPAPQQGYECDEREGLTNDL